MTVTSQPGIGSIFRIEIPLEPGDRKVAIAPTANRYVVGIRGGEAAPPRILVVDDQFENRDWLVKLLTIVGFDVRSAENGEEALRSWDEWKPELILMDVHMPVMGGLEATRQIKAAPGKGETIIVALTASAMDGQRQLAVDSGVDDFLAKPFDQNELFEKMRGHLRVVYDYAETSGDEGVHAAGVSALAPERLSQLPDGLIAELRAATLKGKKRIIDGLITKVRAAGHAESANGLQGLADSYDYGALARYLEAACRQ